MSSLKLKFHYPEKSTFWLTTFLLAAALTQGCDANYTSLSTESNNTIDFDIPQVIRQVQSINSQDLSLEVSLNNGPPQIFNAISDTGLSFSGQWSVSFDAPQFSENTLTASWFVHFENTKLLIASQQNRFTTTNSSLTLTLTEEYTNVGPEFDFDGDGFSNLAELNAQTNPLSFDEIAQIALEPELLAVPATCFLMGSEEPGSLLNENPQQVCVSDFSIAKYEVTFEEYDRYTLATGKAAANDNNWGRGSLPVINITHADATAYARWLSAQTGNRYRLPTEAEWELAARAGSITSYNTGDSISVFEANFNSIMQRTTPVGSYASNDWGLFDTHGNVAEWTCNAFTDDYDGQEQRCDSASNTGTEYSYRGGSWLSPLAEIRTAHRQHPDNAYTSFDLGFRLALDY